MPRRRRRLFTLLAVLTALITACGGQSSSDLPEGAGLLADSATAMRTVTSARVGIDVEGELPGVPIKSAQGQLTSDGSASGTASLDMGRQLFEVTFVIIGEDLYLRGPTGGFQKLSTSSAFLVYDPTVILDPDRGVAAVLAGGTGATTEAREQVEGVDSYRVQATFPGQTLGSLAPGSTQDSTGQVWIATEGSRLVQTRFPLADGATVTVRFSDYDAPAEITPPI